MGNCPESYCQYSGSRIRRKENPGRKPLPPTRVLILPETTVELTPRRSRGRSRACNRQPRHHRRGSRFPCSRFPPCQRHEPGQPDREPEVTADRARRGIDRLGRIGGPTIDDAGYRNRVRTFQHHQHRGAGGDELDKTREKRLAFVLAVVLPGPSHRKSFRGASPRSGALASRTG